MDLMHFPDIFSPLNKDEENEKEFNFNFFGFKEDSYLNKIERSFCDDNQFNSIEEQSFGKLDNSNNENKDDILAYDDIVHCETPPEKQEFPKQIVDNTAKMAIAKTKACTTKTQKSWKLQKLFAPLRPRLARSARTKRTSNKVILSAASMI